ncbi:MAG: class I SAM-dependent methyltransferase, partial [Syntrophobacteraceae bacterium]
VLGAITRLGTEWWWMDSQVYLEFERLGFHITQDTFYSPLPNIGTVSKLKNYDHPYEAACRVFEVDVVMEWKKLSRFQDELADIQRSESSGYYWDNPFFPNIDAIAYYGMIRNHQPKLVVEIGSGFSTHIALRALQKNGTGELRIIEPHPTPKLLEIVERTGLGKFYQSVVQDFPAEFFGRLSAGDVLFIDSSHVSKLGSDVNHILFNIFPDLPKGILVHFHDVFLPFEYPKGWIIEKNWSWNEQYLLLAFLMNNRDYRPVISNHLLLRKHANAIKEDLSTIVDVGPLSGASIWLKHLSGD